MLALIFWPLLKHNRQEILEVLKILSFGRNLKRSLQLFVSNESEELNSIFKRLKKKDISCEQEDTGKRVTQCLTNVII